MDTFRFEIISDDAYVPMIIDIINHIAVLSVKDVCSNNVLGIYQIVGMELVDRSFGENCVGGAVVFTGWIRGDFRYQR